MLPLTLALLAETENPAVAWIEDFLSNHPAILAVVLSSPLGILVLIVFAVNHLKRSWDRQRITEQVTAWGGSVLEIRPASLFSWPLITPRHSRSYEVTYRAGSGTTTATCSTNLFIGVVWTNAAPPNLGLGRPS